MKILFTFLFMAFAVPAIVRCEPITYQLTFKATGTFTPYGTGVQPVPINGNVVVTMRNTTSNVQIETDGDGDPIGFQTSVKDVSIIVPGVVSAASSPILFLSPTGGSQEIYQEQISPLSLSLVFSLASGNYNLQSNVSTTAALTVDYFNMGVLVTSKGVIRLNPENVQGTFVGKLNSSSDLSPATN